VLARRIAGLLDCWIAGFAGCNVKPHASTFFSAVSAAPTLAPNPPFPNRWLLRCYALLSGAQDPSYRRRPTRATGLLSTPAGRTKVQTQSSTITRLHRRRRRGVLWIIAILSTQLTPPAQHDRRNLHGRSRQCPAGRRIAAVVCNSNGSPASCCEPSKFPKVSLDPLDIYLYHVRVQT
jgi:hypothetical protein